MFIGLHAKYMSICQTLNFLDIFSKNTQISNLIQFRPVGAELFHTDRWTEKHDEAKGLF